MKSFTFSIRNRQYRAECSPDEHDVVTVTGQVRGKGGNLLPNIVPLIVKELLSAGFPASPWASYWREFEGSLQFIASQTQAWVMVKAAFQEIVKADEVCVHCHIAAKKIARRSGLAEACGIVVPNRTYWLWLEGISRCYTTRLKELWLEFESPLKALFDAPDRFFVFPANAYPKGDGMATPLPGDLDWVVERMGGVAKGLGHIFNRKILLEVVVSDLAGHVQMSSGYGCPSE